MPQTMYPARGLIAFGQTEWYKLLETSEKAFIKKRYLRIH